VRAHTNLAAGGRFGIRGPEDVRALGDAFDGVVVGARWLELLSGEDREAGLAAVRNLARELTRRAGPGGSVHRSSKRPTWSRSMKWAVRSPGLMSLSWAPIQGSPSFFQ